VSTPPCHHCGRRPCACNFGDVLDRIQRDSPLTDEDVEQAFCQRCNRMITRCRCDDGVSLERIREVLERHLESDVEIDHIMNDMETTTP